MRSYEILVYVAAGYLALLVNLYYEGRVDARDALLENHEHYLYCLKKDHIKEFCDGK